MVWKEFLAKLKGKVEIKEEAANRFLKFYHRNQKRLLKERKKSYYNKRKEGICVRCSEKVVPGIIFCLHHQQKQVEYNQKARKS
ncbi:hypothetical protein HY495_02715 [Candidatus Woesearchaeota archaeon]|nr:hypothetical protein [Candidatus Woesearchaeota archaeon]